MPATATPTAADAALAQRRAAAMSATRVRSANAKTIKEIRGAAYMEGLAIVADMLRHGDMDSPLGAIPIWRLVQSIKWMGDHRTEQVLSAADVFRPNRPLRRLTERQRHLLAGALDDVAADARPGRPQR